jgi:hypothetical protein
MTDTVKIYGHSDDIIEFDGAVMASFDCPNTPWMGTLIAPDGNGLIISAIYSGSGTWAIGAGALDEDVRIPAWPMTLGNSEDCNYSAVLTIDVPEGTVVAEL